MEQRDKIRQADPELVALAESPYTSRAKAEAGNCTAALGDETAYQWYYHRPPALRQCATVWQ